MKKQELIYLDNSATTQVSKEVYEAMKPYFTSEYFNSDSLYYQAREVKKEVEAVRELIAETINADPDEIFFTSGGSESNTWAIKILADNGFKSILTTPIEHHSVLNAINQYMDNPLYAKLESDNNTEHGISTGKIDTDELEFMLKRIPVQSASIMMANNEIGTVQPIPMISGMLKEYGISVHSDCVQSFMHIPIDVDTLGVDMLSVSAHKIGGPKGVGFLYIRKEWKQNNIDIKPLICGGQQEEGLRGGTTNVPGIIGFGKAIEINKQLQNKLSHKSLHTNIFGSTIESALMNCKGLDFKFTGSMIHRLPNHMSLCFRDINGQQLVSMLAEKGILCSTGSACNSGNPKPSYVLEAINVPEQFINGAIRITWNPQNTKEQAIMVAKAIEDCITILRRKQNEI